MDDMTIFSIACLTGIIVTLVISGIHNVSNKKNKKKAVSNDNAERPAKMELGLFYNAMSMAVMVINLALAGLCIACAHHIFTYGMGFSEHIMVLICFAMSMLFVVLNIGFRKEITRLSDTNTDKNEKRQLINDAYIGILTLFATIAGICALLR